MATTSLAAGSVVIKVPLPQKKASRNNKPPAIAVRLQEREAPARSPTSPVREARRELLINEEKAKKADAARAHNARVQAVRHHAHADAETHERLKESLDERFENAETIRWYAIDDKIEKAVHNGTFAVARAAERLECRKAKLAQHIDHSLESAEEKRRAVLRKVQFKASNVVQKHKAVVTQQAQSARSAAARIADQLQVAARKRAAVLAERAHRAAALSAGRGYSSRRAAQSRDADSKNLAASLQARMAAAECLHHLNLRLRQSKAALANEHHSLVVARKRRVDVLMPLVHGARIAAELLIAGERRSSAVAATEAKARAVTERSKRAHAAREEQAKFDAEISCARLECKLAAAAARREHASLARRLHGNNKNNNKRSGSSMSAPTSPAGSPTVSPRAHSSKSSPTPPELLPRGLRPTSAASRADEKPLMGNAYYAPMPSWGFSTLVPAPQRATANQSHEAEEAAGEAVMAAGEAAMSQQTINQVEAPKKNVPADCRGNKTHGNETAKWGLEGTFLAAEDQRAAHARLSDGVLSENSAAAGLAGGAAQRKASLSSFTARGHLKVGKPFSTRAPAAAKSAATKSAAGTEPASTKSTTTRGGTQSERLGFMSWMRGVRLADADAKDAAAATALICTYPLPDTEQEDWEVVPSGADTGNDDWEQVVVDREPAEGDLVFA